MLHRKHTGRIIILWETNLIDVVLSLLLILNVNRIVVLTMDVALG